LPTITAHKIAHSASGHQERINYRNTYCNFNPCKSVISSGLKQLDWAATSASLNPKYSGSCPGNAPAKIWGYQDCQRK
jgi:hypothetical protein